ncbi:AfsR/SARP family transcriptional regulator [Streptomyces tubercidicus]|nr:AfsR/SARP family transcriptional regulator [Streptomyces tubercidicus]WSX21490.1 AfsR/SARP family transcriptional regulator [Streptomyces tubercidicus]
MEFRTLGSLEVRVDGREITPTAPKQRQALALLILRAGQRVTMATLLGELWDGFPPRTAMTALQTYIGVVRRTMAEATGGTVKHVSQERLVTDGNGYVLRVADHEWDRPAFDHLVVLGREAIARDDAGTAERLLREALAQWQGQPLNNVRIGPILAPHIRRLREIHLGARELLIEALLRTCKAQEAVEEATELTSEYPCHENIHAQLMRALYASGRRASALDVYQRLRTHLDTLGISPSPSVNTLHHAMLQDEPDEEFLALFGATR